jgi:hypothetical protein
MHSSTWTSPLIISLSGSVTILLPMRVMDKIGFNIVVELVAALAPVAKVL